MLTASLKHHFEAVGGNIVQITFEDTEVKVTGGIGGLLVSSHALIAYMHQAMLPCMMVCWAMSSVVMGSPCFCGLLDTVMC